MKEEVDQYIAITQEIQQLQERIQLLKERRSRSSSFIVDTLREQYGEKCPLIQTDAGNVRVCKTKTTQALSLKYVREALQESYDTQTIEQIVDVLKNKRSSKVTYDLKFTEYHG